MSEVHDLLQQFRRGLAFRRATLEAAWRNTDPEAGFKAVYRAAHNLAGAAGAYERHDLAQAAAEVEKGVAVWLKAPPDARPPAAGLRRLLGRPWQRLMDAIEAEAAR